MPRGKYVNHKGRSRHFTSPEELQHQHDDESSEEEEGTSSEGEEGQGGAAGTSGDGAKAKTKSKVRAKKPIKTAASSSEDDSDAESSEEEDKDAKKGVSSLIEIENPNRVAKKSTQKLKNLTLEDDQVAAGSVKPELSRREREQIEKQKERARYEKLHAAGKTTEAKADLARLALIRQQRAEAAAKRDAEKKAVEEKKSSGTSKS